MTRPPVDCSIAEIAAALRTHEVTAEALMEACLERIASKPSLNAFIAVLADSARGAARQADRELAVGHDRGFLHGIPISVKDLIDMKGVPTTAASRVRQGHRATEDAPIVDRLRSAGAVVVGKCNLHEFAYGTTSEETAFGAIRNPVNPDHSAGGSSGGSAAAVATGMSVASIGTDTGGSIRIPSAACGVVGLKPAYGDVSCEGVVPLSRSLDHVGPLARSVSDAWMVYAALMGDRVVAPVVGAPAGLRLGIPRPYFFDVVDDDVRRRFEEAVQRLRDERTTVVDVQIAHATEIAAIYLHIALPEASAYHASALERTPDAYSPGVRLRLEMGRYVLAEDYVRALQGREVLRREVDAALENLDALVLPTLPIPSPTLGAASVRIGGRSEPVRNVMLRLTQLFNLTGHPAISIPCGLTRNGMPCGLQLVGRRDSTTDLLRAALACEPAVRFQRDGERH